nr:Gag-Pol polyprotein [Tanacetum cinerariifolium]
MPKESQLLTMIETLGDTIIVEQQKHELLKVKLEKRASDSRDILASLIKRIKILENDFQRSQAQSIDFELKMQHQKENIDCDVSWKEKLSTLHDENVLLKHQIESTVKERENIILEYQRLFNLVKATRDQHKKEINEMFEDVTQKTYAYAEVRTVRFRNDHFAAITDYGDYVQGNLTIWLVYYVEGLGHNLFLVRQFCDGDLEHNKTLYELICGRNPNVQYFHVFGSLFYSTNDHDDLGKMKPKADIGIFVGYFESSRGFCIYNHQTKKIMEMIHVKFDELTATTSEYLVNLFGPMYEQYYVTSSQEVFDDFAENTRNNDHTSSSSSIVVDQDDAPPIVVSLKEQVVNEPNSLVLNEVVDEFVQKDVANFDGNMFHNAPQTPEFDVAESSLTYQDPLNMHQFHQQHRSIGRWTKNHPLEQVIDDPLKLVMTRKRLQTDA